MKVENRIQPHEGDTFWVWNCGSDDISAVDWAGSLTPTEVQLEAVAIAQIRGI